MVSTKVDISAEGITIGDAVTSGVCTNGGTGAGVTKGRSGAAVAHGVPDHGEQIGNCPPDDAQTNGPDETNPSLHAGWHDWPRASGAVHVPRPPLAGAVTVHAKLGVTPEAHPAVLKEPAARNTAVS